MRTGLVFLLSWLLLPLGAWASEGIYRYVEKDGTIIYTNVPPPGSKKARQLKGTFTEAQKPSAPVRGRASAPEELEPHISTASRRYRIPASLVRAIMQAESNFDSNAVSPKGACGLMQLMPQTATEMYVKDIFDEKENIEGGVRYLRVLANTFEGDMVKMIAAYNAGPQAVRKYGGSVPPYTETQEYVRKVLQLYHHYKERERLARNEPREANADGDDASGGAGDESR
ncbi:lytic transglycosylase domain-containing protein [Stigmatella aurantiaca]|uniref:Transglycosylase SLT domain protein n=1 Tax=Stigmatella aurantiaca (strain DW4/3-1) TaxID=378806 RepID=E3FPH6_STIAD|nr:lytic transglycosylase domain-containing protein [Stigmatella aurantiaca]ADO73171.1 Transglycosylase SLT domain protein [Stigmatella aurantiaca DW4/3-1]